MLGLTQLLPTRSIIAESAFFADNARLVCSLSQEPQKIAESFVPRGAKSRMRRTETPKPIWIKFGMLVDIPDELPIQILVTIG